MRQSKEEEEEKAAAAATSPVPKPGTNDSHGDAASEPDVDEEDDNCDLESLLPALGRRIGRQWKPALQSIAEGRDG